MLREVKGTPQNSQLLTGRHLVPKSMLLRSILTSIRVKYDFLKFGVKNSVTFTDIMPG